MNDDTNPPRIWRAPIVLALAIVVGLLTALVGDGWWDAASWLLLGLPLAVMGWFIKRS